jgi:hypothetical protein
LTLSGFDILAEGGAATASCRDSVMTVSVATGSPQTARKVRGYCLCNKGTVMEAVERVTASSK